MVLPSAAFGMTCSFKSITGLIFGSYDIFSGSPLDSVGSMTYRCDDVGYQETLVIDLGRGSSSTYAPRKMFRGAYELDYNLYLDSNRTSIWGDGSSGTSHYGPVSPANGEDTTVYVYGRVLVGQNARTGSYSDTVVVTVLF
jgi:spore coat protein U-like protein